MKAEATGSPRWPPRLRIALPVSYRSLSVPRQELHAASEQIFAADRVEAIAQLAVIAIGLITEHRHSLKIPTRRSLHELHAELILSLKDDVLGDLGLAPTLGI